MCVWVCGGGGGDKNVLGGNKNTKISVLRERRVLFPI